MNNLTDDQENQILLFWSDELNASERDAVEQLLRKNEAARALLADLEFQAKLARESRSSTNSGKSIAAAAAEIVAGEYAASKITPFPISRKFVAIAGSIAAAIVIGIFIVNQPPGMTDPLPVADSSTLLRPGKMAERDREITDLESRIASAKNRTRFRSPRA